MSVEEMDNDINNEIEIEEKVEAQENSETEEHFETDENHSEIVAENSELAQFQSANIEEIEFVEAERVESIIESVLFASDSPVSLHTFKEIFKGTSVKVEQIRRSLEILSVE